MDERVPIADYNKLEAELAAARARIAELEQELAALKGDLHIEDLPPEKERTKLEEWQACYSSLFRQMNAQTQEIARLQAIEKAAEKMREVQDIEDAVDWEHQKEQGV
jgi:predicted  nucleic acid-binding Zn-ribbon protein